MNPCPLLNCCFVLSLSTAFLLGSRLLCIKRLLSVDANIQNNYLLSKKKGYPIILRFIVNLIYTVSDLSFVFLTSRFLCSALVGMFFLALHQIIPYFLKLRLVSFKIFIKLPTWLLPLSSCSGLLIMSRRKPQ